MNNLEDITLISRILIFHDKSAYDKLIVKYQSSVRRFLLYLTKGDHHVTDDLAQDTFLKAYLKLQSFKNTAKFSTWIFRIAYNVFYDYQKKNREDITEAVDVAENTISFDDNSILSHDLNAALSCLKTDEKAITLLFYMEDLPIEKISAIMNMPKNSVKSHLYRARVKMKEFLKLHGYE